MPIIQAARTLSRQVASQQSEASAVLTLAALKMNRSS